MMQQLALGIDIGGTNTAFGVVNRRGEILESGSISTNAYVTIEAFIDALQKTLQPLIELYGKAQFMGMGVGAPNGNLYTGEIVFAPNLPWKGLIPLAELLAKAFNMPAFITNDANAAAIGEMMYGAAKGMSDFVMVTLGTGVGSGFVSNGQLINGHDGLAGELGHVIVRKDGRLCGCGRYGCLETYTSATGVAKTAHEKVSVRGGLLKETLPHITSADVYKAAQAGDAVAIEIFDETAELLGFALANTIAITSPKAIILFGGLARAGDYLLAPLKKYMEQYVLKIYRNKVALLPSMLPANDAAILGASALVWQ